MNFMLIFLAWLFKKDEVMFKIITLSAMLFIAPFTLPQAGAASTPDARAYVDNIGQQVITVLNSSTDKEKQRLALEKLFQDNVDINWMGQFVLGNAWRQASPEQRQSYLEAYRQYLLARYTHNFAEYTGAKYTITDAKMESNGEFTVAMQINTPQAENTIAGYRLRESGTTFKIIDIVIEGVSLLATERSEFASVVQQKGMDGLIQAIKEKIKTVQQK